jgi:hypothetical protein
MHIGYAARCNVWSTSSSSSKASPCTASATCAARATHFLPTSSGPRVGGEAHFRPPNQIRRPKVGSHETETLGSQLAKHVSRMFVLFANTKKWAARARREINIGAARGPSAARPTRTPGRLGIDYFYCTPNKRGRVRWFVVSGLYFGISISRCSRRRESERPKRIDFSVCRIIEKEKKALGGAEWAASAAVCYLVFFIVQLFLLNKTISGLPVPAPPRDALLLLLLFLFLLPHCCRGGCRRRLLRCGSVDVYTHAHTHTPAGLESGGTDAGRPIRNAARFVADKE